MLKYMILSTPRTGSSTLMACAEQYFGRGTFVREPLNPYEEPRLLPPLLRDASPDARAAILCDPACPILGIKHVVSPFNRLMADQSDLLRRVLSVQGLRVILLTRKNVRHQFISMEIAIQTGDWWSGGPDALPASLDVVKAGRKNAIDDATVGDHLATLQGASIMLRDTCRDLRVDFIEASYEDLFAGEPQAATRNVLAALSHFGVGAEDPKFVSRLSRMLREGRRFEEIGAIHRNLGQRYPSLRN